MKDGEFWVRLERVQQHFTRMGHKPETLFTHGDLSAVVLCVNCRYAVRWVQGPLGWQPESSLPLHVPAFCVAPAARYGAPKP